MTAGWMRSWTLRHWAVALSTLAGTLLIVGVPADLIDTPLFTRMTPTLWWNYPVWVATGLLGALVAATYVAPPAAVEPSGQRRSVLAGVGSFLAVGCPICNKLIVALLGVGGALTFFAPIQPYLGVGSLAMLLVVLRIRMRATASCRRTPRESGAATGARRS